MTRLTAKGLWKEYDDQVVLENVNLEIGDHEFVTVIGASGCGKTTFLRLLLGVEAPTRGRLLLDGRPLPNEPGPDRGIVFQRYSLFPHLSVLDNLLLGLELRGSRALGRLLGRRRRAALDTAEQLLDAVGLHPSRDKYPSQLSGGMQQRLSIAQSVICEPQVLLLDEPFGALDPGVTADMHQLILKLWNIRKMTIIMVTHDLKESFYLGTRLLVFDKTRIDPQAQNRYGATITYDIPLRGRREPQARGHAGSPQVVASRGDCKHARELPWACGNRDTLLERDRENDSAQSPAAGVCASERGQSAL
jgi:NitT/TauT family transport system ATP-binding protein